VVFAFGTLLSLWNWVWSAWRKVPAPSNPFGADSLEWATTSPPPEYNFAAIPLVAGRHPLWQQDPLPAATSGTDEATRSLGIEGALRRENPVTGGLEGRPEETSAIPRETYLPFLLAFGLAVFFTGLLIEAVVVGVMGLVLGLVGLIWWAWRTEMDLV
jgi:heme/copper-type cytochrome/quinol oxidase subunit 1